MTALPNLEGPDLIVMCSSFKGRKSVAFMRVYCGTFRRDRPTMPATGRPLYVPHNGCEPRQDWRSSCLWDVLKLIHQASIWPLVPSLNTEEILSGPGAADGLFSTPQTIKYLNPV